MSKVEKFTIRQTPPRNPQGQWTVVKTTTDENGAVVAHIGRGASHKEATAAAIEKQMKKTSDGRLLEVLRNSRQMLLDDAL